MPRHIILFCIALLTYNVSIAQHAKIVGAVHSGSLQLASASIQLKAFSIEDVIFYGFTNQNGSYDISGKLDQSEKFVLIASYIGYKRDSIIINRATLFNREYKYDFNLLEDKKQLDEIYIKAPPPVEVNNDTTKYNVLHFTTPEDRNLESVINKMPGMEVSKDGTIFFKGKRISKVLLEGDDLTGEGYKTITKNLKPELVEEVQALEHYIEDDLLKGIINSDEIVLNLKVKDKYSKKVVGSVEGGLGTESRRQISTTLISFLNKTKAFAFVNHNNLNNGSNSSVLDLADENRKINGTERIIKHEIGIYNPFDDKLYNINKTLQVSFNAITKLSEKFKVNYSFFYYQIKLRGQTTTENNYFPPNSVYVENRDNRTSLNRVLNANLSTDYQVRKNSRLLMKFNYQQQPIKFSSSAFSIYNDKIGDSVLQNQNDISRLFNGLVKYTIKANKRTAYLFSAKISSDHVDQNYSVSSNLYSDISIFNGSNNLSQQVNNKNFNVKIDAEALKRYNKSFLYFNAGNEIIHFRVNSDLLDHNQTSVGPDYSNDNLFKINNTYIATKYVYDNELIKFTAQWKSTLQSLKSMGKDSTNFIIEPSVAFVYNLNQIQNISLVYNYRNNNPQPIEYYQNYILTDIRSFNSGLSNFYNYNTHSLTFGYGYNDFSNSYFNLNVVANGSYSEYGFLYTNFFDNTLNYSEKQPYKGVKTFSININTKKFIPFLSSTLTINYAPSITNYYNQFGDGAKKYNALNQLLKAKVNTGFNLPYNFGLGVEFMQFKIKSEGDLITKSNAYKYTLDYRYKINPKFFNTLSYSVYRMNTQDFKLIDSEFQYNPLRGNFKYSIQGKNLLNLKAFTSLNVNEVSSSSYSSSILGRYIILIVSMSIK